MKTVTAILALVLTAACATSIGGNRPSIPMSMPDRCDFHIDWQCNNTMNWLLCEQNEQCIKDNDIAI